MNNFYPYYNRQQTPYYPAQSGIIWVQGIEGAKAYQLAPNTNAVLLDSEREGIFYIKVADSVGMCTLRTFKYTEITDTPAVATTDLSEYVKKSELQELIAGLIPKETQSNDQSVPATKSKHGLLEF